MTWFPVPEKATSPPKNHFLFPKPAPMANLEGTINFVSGTFTSVSAEAETIVPFANAETKDTFLILSEFNFASGAYVKLEKKSNLLVNFVLKFKPAFTATPDKLDWLTSLDP